MDNVSVVMTGIVTIIVIIKGHCLKKSAEESVNHSPLYIISRTNRWDFRNGVGLVVKSLIPIQGPRVRFPDAVTFVVYIFFLDIL